MRDSTARQSLYFTILHPVEYNNHSLSNTYSVDIKCFDRCVGKEWNEVVIRILYKNYKTNLQPHRGWIQINQLVSLSLLTFKTKNKQLHKGPGNFFPQGCQQPVHLFFDGIRVQVKQFANFNV